METLNENAVLQQQQLEVQVNVNIFEVEVKETVHRCSKAIETLKRLFAQIKKIIRIFKKY
jgi:hypothetical protein